MKGAQHKLWAKASSHTHSVASSYKNRAVKVVMDAPKPAILAETFTDEDGRPGRWTVMRTGPKQEAVAVKALREDGYAAYCPVITSWVRIGQTISMRHNALFPRYVFVGMKPGARRSLNACLWGDPLRLDSGNIPFIPASLVHRISDQQLAGEFDETKTNIPPEVARLTKRKASDHYKPGDLVVIENDMFKGLNAEIVHAGEESRVIALISLLGRATRVQIGLDGVRPAA